MRLPRPDVAEHALRQIRFKALRCIERFVSSLSWVQALLALMEDVPSSLLLKLLQAARNLSSEPQSMRQMQAAGAVQKLVSFIKKGASDSRVKLTPVLHLPLLEVCCSACLVLFGA